MAQQKATEWLAVKLFNADSNPRVWHKFIEQAKEMEKQQHGQTWDAAIAAHDNRGGVHARSLVDFDEWYEQQFKK